MLLKSLRMHVHNLFCWSPYLWIPPFQLAHRSAPLFPSVPGPTSISHIMSLEEQQQQPSLISLVLDGDLEGIKAALEAGANVNETKNGLTPVLSTAFVDDSDTNLAIFHQLMKHGANLEVEASLPRNPPNMRPLHFAAISGRLAICNAMLEAGANVNAVNGNGETPLLLAMQNRHEEVIDSLLQHGADPTIASTRGGTPLIVLAEPIPEGEKWTQDYDKDARLARKMIQAGVDVNAVDDEGMSALHWAVQNGHAELAAVLLKEGNANVNIQGNDGQTPLFLATVLLIAPSTPESTRQRINGILDLLVQHGADENIASKLGPAPFTLAMQSGRPDLMKRMDRHVVQGEYTGPL